MSTSEQIGDVMLYHGDCRDVLPTLPEAAAAACVTDPPYNLGFMGRSWDATGVAFRPETWAAVARCLKPGALLLAFGGTRTYHRMACAIEDAGFDIEDSIHWLYGQGFPKHKSKLKPAHEPIVVARKPGGGEVVECGRVPSAGNSAECSATCVQQSDGAGLWDENG